MAQFDVHRNSGKQRDSIPYVVVVQSAIYDGYNRRVVVPLVRESDLGSAAHPSLNPRFKIQNVTVALHPLQIVSVPERTLGDPVDSLAAESNRIVAALDELLSRAWG
ncbi:MAG: CcdB family protein [Steroidobacteraceae bacterium]